MADSKRFLEGPRGVRKVLALDASCFLYHFEGHPDYVDSTRSLFSLLEQSRCKASTSVLTVMEAQTLPLTQGRDDLASLYRQVFSSFSGMLIVPIDMTVAATATRLKVKHGLRTPEALHVACALTADADAFVTGDARLAKINEIEVVLL